MDELEHEHPLDIESGADFAPGVPVADTGPRKTEMSEVFVDGAIARLGTELNLNDRAAKVFREQVREIYNKFGQCLESNIYKLILASRSKSAGSSTNFPASA